MQQKSDERKQVAGRRDGKAENEDEIRKKKTRNKKEER